MEFEPSFPSLFFRQRLNATVLPMLGGIFIFLWFPLWIAIAVLTTLSVVTIIFAFFKRGEWRKTLLCFLAGLSLALLLMGLNGLEENRLEKLCHTPRSAEGYVLAENAGTFDIALCRLDNRAFYKRVRVETDADWKVGEKRKLTLVLYSPYPESAREEGIKLLASCLKGGDVIGKSVVYSAVGQIRQSVLAKFSSTENGGFLSAVLLGERSGLTEAQTAAFRRTASSHILAISGLHISQTVAFFVCLLRLLPLPRNLARILLYPFVIALFLLAGAGVSVFRASVMTLFALTGILFRYRSDSTTALCFSAALLVLSNLYALESPSFLLSYASTLGLTTCGIPLSEYVRQRFTKKEMPRILKHLQALTLSLAMATVSFVFTTPVQLMLFDTASPFAPLYSVLLVPLFQICLILTLLGALSIPFLPDFVSSLLLRAAAAFPDLVEFLSKGAPAPVKIDDFSVMVACSFIAFLCVAFWKKAPCTAVFLLHGISFAFFGLISLINGIFD